MGGERFGMDGAGLRNAGGDAAGTLRATIMQKAEPNSLTADTAKATALTVRDPWSGMRALTDARIALGRAGGSLPTAEVLDFRLAHAEARDAVLMPFDAAGLAAEVKELNVETLMVESAARNRAEYLRRPDAGRRLSEESRKALTDFAAGGGTGEEDAEAGMDLVIIVADGLSTQASRQVAPVLGSLLPKLRGAGWRVAPVVVASQARVALQDEIGSLLGARMSVILLGERPGLDCADSLGAYFTWDPKPGRTDAERNCLSNIRAAGLPPEAAAERLFFLLTESRRRKLSGTALKDEGPGAGMLGG